MRTPKSPTPWKKSLLPSEASVAGFENVSPKFVESQNYQLMHDKQDSVSLNKNKDKKRILDMAKISPLKTAKLIKISSKFAPKSPNAKSATPVRDKRHNFMEYERYHPKGTKLNFSPFASRKPHQRSSDLKRKIEESNMKYRVGHGIESSPKAKSLARRFVMIND